MQLLTYLAQVRQLHCKNALPLHHHAPIKPHILLIKPRKKRGILSKGIAITGTVRVVAWEEPNRSMGVWLKDAGHWHKTSLCFSSQSHVEERKFRISTRKKTMENGLTGFWMRVDYKLNVKVVNGTMYKLLNAKSAFTLTHILHPHIVRQSLRALLYAKRKNRRADNTKSSYPKVYGLIGLKARSRGRGWASNTTLLSSKMQKQQAVISPSTYLNPPFSRLIGLRDGSASDTLKAFQMRRKGKPTP